jgi:dipeptidyl aminopeptidase/acylaminoacyl peptidase
MGVFLPYNFQLCLTNKSPLIASNYDREDLIVLQYRGDKMNTRRVFFALLVASAISVSSISAEESPTGSALFDKSAYTPDIATFMQIGACALQDVSWDGQDVYFTSGMSGVNQVYRLTPEGWPYQLTTFEDGAGFFALSPGGKLAVVGASVGGNEQSQLYLMDTRAGRLSQLTDKPTAQFGSVVWANDSRTFFFRTNEIKATDFYIFACDVNSGKYNVIFGDSVSNPGKFDPASVSPDGSTLIVQGYTSNFNTDLYLLDLKSGKYQQLSKDESDVVYGAPQLLPDNKTIWLTCNDNPSGLHRLATMTVGSPKVTYVEDGWLDAKWEIEGLSLTRDFKHIAVVLNEDGYNRLYLREFDTQKSLPAPPLEGMVGRAVMSKGGSCVISFSSASRTSDLWYWNPYNQQVKQLTFSMYAGIDRSAFVDPTLIRYKSFDGLEIPALLYLPAGYKKGTPIPFVVDAHGGPEGQSQPNFARNYQYLLLNGYGILAPNPRGSSGYGREYLALDDYKNRKNSLKDYKAAVEWLFANNYSAAGKVAIRGGSYGGYVVLGMITDYPDLFSAAIENVGIANFKTFLENTAAYRRSIREAEYGPLTDPEFLASISPIHKANLIKTPLLVIHGANDPRVPVGEARQMIAAIQANGGMVDSLIFVDEGHGAGKRPNIIIEYRKQVEFLDQHLKKSEMKTKGE